jgi:hypothetical protein
MYVCADSLPKQVCDKLSTDIPGLKKGRLIDESTAILNSIPSEVSALL